jgi:hypothetical protein
MFAVKRIASVPGRIRFLIVSIITMNGISIVGVPFGTGCSNTWLVFLIHPNNINLNHNGRANVRVSVKCLVLVKMYGNSPRKIVVKIIRNSAVKINKFPSFSFPFIKSFLFLGLVYLLINHLILGRNMQRGVVEINVSNIKVQFL